MTNTEKFFVECVKRGIKNEKIDVIPQDLDYKKLYKLCAEHSMSVIVFSALECVKQQLLPEFYNAMQRSVHRHIMLDAQSEFDKNVFLSEMDKRGLKYMPLKGYHLKKIYPHTAMRYTSDCDVLIDINQLNLVRELVDELGLKTKRHDEHHDIVYYPNTKTVFELHKTVFVGQLEKYFINIFERSYLKKGTNSFYEMSAEDFYISILAHSAYHFAEDAGVGIRHLTDIYLYKKTYKLNYQYLDKEFEKCGLLKFKNEFEKVSDYLFDDCDADEKTIILAKHIIESSLLQNAEKKSASDVAANGKKNNIFKAKSRTIFKAIFPISANMEFSYPILKKHKYLLPFFYPIRWFHVIFMRPGNILKLKKYGLLDETSLADIKKIREILGIENF